MGSLVNNKNSESYPYEIMYKLNVKQDIDEHSAYESLKKIFEIQDERLRSALLGVILNGVMIKGATLSEVVGLLDASLSLDHIVRFPRDKLKLSPNEILLGYAGSGKKGKKTVNISTPASIVAASCGGYIAKACSRSTSSLSGSSDFLKCLGIDINIDLNKKIKALEEIGVAFFSIEATTPRFAEIYGGLFYAPHALSYALAGLSLPFEVDVMAYGLSHHNIQLSIEVFKHYGFNNAMVFNTTEDGIHYIDEVGVSGTFNYISIENGELGRATVCPISEELNFKNKYSMCDIMQKTNIDDNIRQVVLAICGKGEESLVDVISANAALLIYLSHKARDLKEGFLMAKDSILSGKTYEKLKDIVEVYESDKNALEALIL